MNYVGNFNLSYFINAKLAKNLTIVKKKVHINTDNVFIIKIHNRSIHSNFKTNEAKQNLLGVN